MTPGRNWVLLRILFIYLLFSSAGGAQNVGVINTSSPRDTVESFISLSDHLAKSVDAYDVTRSRTDYANIRVLTEGLSGLFDLSDVPLAVRSHVGTELVADTLDILARVPDLDVNALPAASDLSATQDDVYRIIGTPLRLQRVAEGTRRGEILFDSHTVAVLTRFDQLRSRRLAADGNAATGWAERFDHITGPMVPAWLTRIAPIFGGTRLLDTPAWKAAIVLLASGIVFAALVFWHKILAQLRSNEVLDATWIKLLGPVSVALATLAMNYFFVHELHLAGRLAVLIQLVNVGILHAIAAWAAWIVFRAAFDRSAARLNQKADSIDVHMLQLIGRIVAAIASVAILALGAQTLGLPVLSILAGFGIGGLAIALAIRPTLENLIGGFILYIDRPIRVGDFCAFGDQSGTVEHIGVRSTQVRALDRTLITIPNAQFADLQLINWAACDMMQIDEVLGVRYETDMDALRFVLAEIRKMMHAHPKIDSETIRVRFEGFGAHSLDIHMRVYAKTREWNDFFAIREDVLFRVGEIVEHAGCSFAFPSQTLYVGEDVQPDQKRSEMSKDQVGQWRTERRLPFPRFSAADLRTFDGTLSYPPRGSPDFMSDNSELSEGTETLSSTQDSDARKRDG